MDSVSCHLGRGLRSKGGFCTVRRWSTTYSLYRELDTVAYEWTYQLNLIITQLMTSLLSHD